MTDIKFEVIDKPEYKVVPVEPTAEIIESICAAHTSANWPEDFGEVAQEIRRYYAAEGYKAMLSAAPAAPATLEPVGVIGGGFNIFWVGSGPIAPIIEKHSLKVGDKLYAIPPDAAAIIAKLTRERESWEKLFGEVALSLKCLPSCFVDDNSHVLRVAKEAMEQLAAVTQERNSFQDQCVRMRHERHVEKEQLAAAQRDAERLNKIALLIGSIFVHGNFKAETSNERELEKLLRENNTFWDSLEEFDAALRGKEGGE